MTTIFSLLCQVCGLSHREAAAFLEVRLDTVKSWSAGRNCTPDAVLDQLAELAALIDEAADRVVAMTDEQVLAHGSEPEVIELGIAADDHEAQLLGWPCVGTHRAAIALAVARGMSEGYNFTVIPRGLTVLTAAASDTHSH